MKRTYEELEIEIVRFETEDVVCASSIETESNEGETLS